jgi:hypothetical protein
MKAGGREACRIRKTVAEMRLTSAAGGSSLVRAWLPFVLLASLAGGCARARAADVAVGPPLAIPTPPERVLAPIEEAPIVTAPGRTEVPTATTPEIPPPQRSQTPPSRPPAEQPRQEPPPAAPAAAPAAGPVTPEVTRQVRTPVAGEEALRGEVEKLLTQAEGHLKRVSQKSLSGANSQQYEESQSLVAVARKALNDGDLPYAMTQAKKAVQLATALPVR